MQKTSGHAAALDPAKWPAAQKLVSRCCDFFDVVKNLSDFLFHSRYAAMVAGVFKSHTGMASPDIGRGPRVLPILLTPGKELEARLNRDFGPGKQLYDDMRRYAKQGLQEGWAATEEVSGRTYRRSKIAEPSKRTHYLSTTTVYMESHGGDGDREGQAVLRGQYHQHPYGEINCVVPLDEKAELKGMQGWQGAGWTSPGPGTHHYPEVRGGALVALVFLPAGRISYEATPDMAQPACV